MKQSGLGIAALITSIIAGLGIVVTFVIAGVMEASSPTGIDEQSPVTVLVGFAILGFMFLALISFGLGVAGLFQKDRGKVLAILGMVFSALMFLGACGLMVLGLLVSSSAGQELDFPNNPQIEQYERNDF